ncbi:hypothetical protein OG728_39430 (plasmid) [Streptomyces microflavus]|uniref:hypothetical protein n=1 Tax=Streptomyces microflavus TaxID=1919 RepID=UPI002E103F28|nr:hypothetical protein OG728_39430 [Streptomyces microflavus]
MIFVNTFLASASSPHAIATLPWWAQLLIGMALLFGGIALGKLNKRKDVDSDALDIVAFALKCAAVVAVLYALF